MEVKKDQLIKLITVTVTQILGDIELVDYQLYGLSVNTEEKTITIEIKLENSCLPESKNRICEVKIKIADIEAWLDGGAEVLVKGLEVAIINAFQQKGN
jgi:hypothetical protein